MSGNVGIEEGCEQRQRWPHSKKVQNLVLAPALRLDALLICLCVISPLKINHRTTEFPNSPRALSIIYFET